MSDETVAYMGWGISAQEQIDGFRREVRELKTENAKLRELLVEVLHELDKVEENVSHGWFWEAARELGVEMDG